MDDNASRRGRFGKKEPGRRERRRLMHQQNPVTQTLKYIQGHRSAILTCVLLLAMVVLLFAIVSQVPIPALTSTSNLAGARTVTYTEFLKQVQDDNLQRVVIQGDDVNGLLKPATTHTSKQSNASTQLTAAQYQGWLAAVSGTSASAFSSASSKDAVPANMQTIYVQVPPSEMAFLVTELNAHGITIDSVPVTQPASFWTLLLRILPVLFALMIGFIIFLFYRNRSQDPMSAIGDRMRKIGKSSARRYEQSGLVVPPSDTKEKRQSPAPHQSSSALEPAGSVKSRVMTIPEVTFDDVAGIDEVRSELAEIVQFLQHPQRYDRLGAHIPRGVLLVGHPGTGKTLLARAVAGEARVPFFRLSASEFVEMFVGVGASRVRDLFAQARRVAPCVIFIDEIDAVGKKRSMRLSGNDERDQTLNQLLVELDGFDSRHAIVVLAATNRADILDPALLRPGRFDRRIMVSPPDRVGREAILRVHSRKTPLHEDVSLERLARLTTGMTGADLANLVNEAALSAARRDQEQVDHECFEEALARVQLGALRPLVMSEAEQRIIAVHEGGHALVAYHLPEADTVNRVTILPRGQSLGVTQFTSEVDRYNYSRETLMTKIAVGLGGRVAEEIVFGTERVTTGAENDLQVVTDLAHKMVTRWGMSEHVGLVFADYQPDNEYSLNARSLDPRELMPRAQSLLLDQHGNVLYNGDPGGPRRFLASASSASGTANGVVMNALIDAEVQRILHEGRSLARSILNTHRDQLTLLADTLMEQEQLNCSQFEALLAPEQ